MHYNKFCPCLFKNLYICTFKMKDLECSWLNFYWPLWNIMFLSSWLFLCTALNKWILLTNKEFPYGCIHSKLISFCTMLYLLEGSTVANLIYMKPYLWYLETWSIEGVLYLCVCSLFQFFFKHIQHIFRSNQVIICSPMTEPSSAEWGSGLFHCMEDKLSCKNQYWTLTCIFDMCKKCQYFTICVMIFRLLCFLVLAMLCDHHFKITWREPFPPDFGHVLPWGTIDPRDTIVCCSRSLVIQDYHEKEIWNWGMTPIKQFFLTDTIYKMHFFI